VADTPDAGPYGGGRGLGNEIPGCFSWGAAVAVRYYEAFILFAETAVCTKFALSKYQIQNKVS
jgi:hypothetical protein